MSCCTGHSVVESLLSSTCVECLNFTSKFWTALRETLLQCLASASWASPHWEQIVSGLSELHLFPWASPKAQTSCTVLQKQCKAGILTVILLWKVSSYLSTPSPVSVLVVSLPVVVLDFFWSWLMRTPCIHNQVPPLSLVYSWPNPLDWNDLIFYAIFLNFQVWRLWISSWILERCWVGKTMEFLVLVLPEFPFRFSGSYFFLEN